MNKRLILGDCLEELDKIEENSIDAIITDPPYELNFMNKGWDNAGVSFNKNTWEKCLRVLKPGGYLLAFGGSRTFHRIACAIEDAGFEIRDTIMWVYGSGFPKSMNIGLTIDKKLGNESKVVGSGKSGVSSRAYQSLETTTAGNYEIKEAQNEWNGWGTQLKPAFEPIIVAPKPFKGSLVDNILEYGVGGLNIDECRVGSEPITSHNAPKGTFAGGEPNRGSDTDSYHTTAGRFPANIIHDGSEEATRDMPRTSPTKPHNGDGKPLDTRNNGWGFKRMPSLLSDNGGSASRYFYCAKASKRDRDEGLDGFRESKTTDGNTRSNPVTARKFGANSALRRNIHPTVKPTALMQYLVRLVCPKGSVILDPFMGSGSTGKAAAYENKERNAGYSFIGIEQNPEYVEIAKARIEFADVDNATDNNVE